MRARSLAGPGILFAAIAVAIALAAPLPAKAQGASTNRYNVVIVTDASGSMAQTDPDDLRFDAIGRFVALLAQKGNKVGVVAFGEGTPLVEPLADAGSASGRQELVSRASEVKGESWTNIGAGLAQAVDMLDEGRDESLPSIVLLLSDGNTDMATDDEKTASLEAKAEAIERARQAGYEIYTVSLNANGAADSTELSQIANATGGEFREVTSADDLQSVYDLYYSLVFDAQADGGIDITIPDSGVAEGGFEIAGVGVEEVNVLVTGSPSDWSLTKPGGSVLTREQLADTTFTSDAFVSLKVASPEAGTWGYAIHGVPGDHVRVDIVRNANMAASLELGTPAGKVEQGSTVEARVTLSEGGRALPMSDCGAFSGELVITGSDGSSSEVALERGSDAFTASFALDERGSYTVEANVSGDGYELATESAAYEVGNAAPRASDTPIEQTVYLLPFRDNTASIDLAPGASDAEDATLSYSVDSSAFLPEEYAIEGSNLVMRSYSLSKGSFTIRATDSEGASCTFDVVVTVVNVGLLTLIGIGAGALVAVLVIGIGTWLALNKRFNGSCYLREFNYDTYGYFEEVMREKGRGRLRLSSFRGVELHGLDDKAYIQASGKTYVTIVSKQPFWASGRMTKKAQVEGDGREVAISKDQTASQGVIVRFESRKLKGRY